MIGPQRSYRRFRWMLLGAAACAVSACASGASRNDPESPGAANDARAPDAQSTVATADASGSSRDAGAASVSDAAADRNDGTSTGEAGATSDDDSSVSSVDTGFEFDAEVSADSAVDGAASDTGIPSPASVLAWMRLVTDYQLIQGPTQPDWVNKWTEAVFYTGVMATYAATSDAKYRDAARTWATGNKWTLLGGTTTPPTRSADNQCAGQVYIELSMLDGGVASEIQNTKASVDAMIAAPQRGRVDWWWADALFMAPPVVARLGAATGNARYAQFLDTMWADTTTYLFDPAHKLVWRDSTFFNTDTFWSRGNGWVVGGIVRVLEDLPASDASTGSYESLLRTLLASVAPLQGADGLWRSNLLHPALFPNPETSGTGLFAYAMAWGLNQGLLDRATYLPIVLKAWQGLTSEVNAQGRLGYVQATGSQPAAATATDSYDYGVGAFLLAASEVARLQ